MPDSQGSGSGPEGENGVKRACDQCRLRKIRCDKESPCSNCRTANRTCSSTGAGQRPKEARQRVLISTQYERKIDYFEARLDNIENMLRELTVSLSSGRSPAASTTESTPGPTASSSIIPLAPPIAPTSPPSSSAAATATAATDDMVYAPTEGNDSDDAVSAFEGDSSLAAQTVFASEFLSHAVVARQLVPLASGGGEGDEDSLAPDMHSALSSLQQIVKLQNRPSPHENRFVNAKPLPKGGVKELPMPPAHVVVAALREVKDVPLVSFATICTFVAADNFTEQCRRVYFATEDYSLMTWGVVNAGLYFLFQEKASLTGDAAQKAQYLEYQAVCRDNLETALANLPLILPARRESIEVVLLGAFYAVENSKFSLARDLNAIAATLCQNLGYHRLRGPLTPETEPKAILFWSAYLLDKALSLRSGRAPVIQDYDITVPRELSANPPGGVEVPDVSWRRILEQWIGYADVLGRAYEQLYSPAALARPPEQRAECARQLVERLFTLANKHDALMRTAREKVQGRRLDANSPYSMDLAILGDEMQHWSALTLLYRAIPSPPGSPSTFNQECIDAARRAFACHHEYMALAGDSMAAKAGFIRWNLIYVPFTPVIVLFCHTIETGNEADLARLAAFVESLVPVCAASDAVAKLHRICQVLHDVASLCIRAKAHLQQRVRGTGNGNGASPMTTVHTPSQQQPQQPAGAVEQQDVTMAMVGDNIDMYLSQLGFMPPQYGASNHHPFATATAATAAQAQFPTVGPTGFGAAGGGGQANPANELGNWFSGNTHILGLLEQDLSEFEPRMWPMGGP